MREAFHMRVVGCRRRALHTAEDADAGVAQVFAIDELPTFLSQCDYVVSVLPSTPQTRGLLAGDVLSACASRQPVLINVGRGDLIDEEAIVAALEKEWISHFVGDVFVPEPLPASSALWSHPKVTVTPHISAVTQPGDVADAFAVNFARFEQGGVGSLLHVFDWDNGY
mmetsp:Transcript_50151/g.131987  ORF Transcript_50151/g.131987 Transcript_50151/m.131987 type:complete len:168 (-) Transcript_50151:231-734(-)